MLKNYFKIAFKVMLRHKLFTFISLFGISFTLLFLVLITSFLDYGFGPVTPEKKLDRTLSVTMGTLWYKTGGISAGPLFSPYFLNRYVKSLETPAAVSISSFASTVTEYYGNKKIEMGIKYTDGEFWQILDFNFLEGRGYTVQEVENREPLAVINQRLKEQYFGDQPAVGKYLEVTGTSFRIAGVVENVSIIRIMPYADIWVPLGFSKTDINKISITSNSFPGWYAMVLAHSRKDFRAIKAEFQQHLRQVEFPDDRYSRILTNTTSYQEAFARQLFRREDNNLGGLFIVLFVLMLIFMLLPTINLVNINISRILERSSEIGVRKSFGASSWSLVGQFLVENIIITLIGGLISLLLATIILGLVNRSGIIPDTSFAINYRIFLASLLITLIFGVFSGVYPAFKMSRLQPALALQGGEK